MNLNWVIHILTSVELLNKVKEYEASLIALKNDNAHLVEELVHVKQLASDYDDDYRLFSQKLRNQQDRIMDLSQENDLLRARLRVASF